MRSYPWVTLKTVEIPVTALPAVAAGARSTMRFERAARLWRMCCVAALAALACAGRELPSRWPENSAASPESPAAPSSVTRTLERVPPLAEGEPGSAAAAPASEHGAHGAPEHEAPPPEHGAHAPEHRAHPPAAAPGDAAVTYTCPMHPDVVSDRPGQCPRCGMALVKRNVSK